MNITRATSILATFGLLLAVAGCGDDGSGDDTALDPGEATLAYADCMRSHGIDMPDPDVTEDGAVSIAVGTPGGDGEPDDIPSHDVFREAEEECGRLLDQAAGDLDRDPEAEAAMLDEMTAVAGCMQERGHNMPDPQAAEGGGITFEIEDTQGSDADLDVTIGGSPDDFDRIREDGLPDDDGYLDDLEACHEEAGLGNSLSPADGREDG